MSLANKKHHRFKKALSLEVDEEKRKLKETLIDEQL